MKRILLLALAATMFAAPTFAQTIVDEWAGVKAPPPPKLQSITLDPKTTAFLALDFLKQNCNERRRPRCVASLPHVLKAMETARANGLLIVHTRYPGTKPEDAQPGFAPQGNEPTIVGRSDKFLGSNLEKILKDKGIQTVVITGTAAQGAVLYTASEAAFRGFKVVVPVDGMSAEDPYFEQFVAYQLDHLPGASRDTVALTRFDMIAF